LEPGIPSNFTFGGGASATLMHPVVIIALIISVLIFFLAPRKYLPIPFFSLIFLGGIGQQVNIGGGHFYVLRILILAGAIRLIYAKLTSKEGVFAGGFDWVDRLFAMWVCFQCLANILRNDVSSGVVIYETGYFLDYIGGYFFLRFLIRDQDDIVRVIKVFAGLTVILGLAMINEKFRNQNIFGYLGALPVAPGVREGAIRAQGALAHPILAGVFGVVLMPLFWWLWYGGKAKVAAVLGFLGSIAMMLTSASSTPLMAFLAAVGGCLFWPFRKRMRLVRWGIVAMIIALHLVMKAPVWMLIARVDVIAGNSGYHRAMLIDQCIRHFSDWWLIGTNAAGTWGWDMWDLSNQFVQEADEGGLATFICFVLIIARTFGKIGKARKLVESDRKQEWYMWLLAVTLLTHCVCFFGITYFDTTKIVWFAFLAIVTAATTPILATAKAAEPVTVPFLTPAVPALRAPQPTRSTAQPGRARQSTGTFFHSRDPKARA